MIRRITVGDFRRAFHVKRDHNREHPETPKETSGARGSKWIERARAGRGGPVAWRKPRGRAWPSVQGPGFPCLGAFRRRRASCGLVEGAARGWLDFGQVRPSMSEQACQKPFLAYLQGKELCRYID